MAYTTIDDPSEYFHTQIYTGDGNDDRSITNDANAGNFSPDWLWLKNRSGTNSHALVDTTRGATKVLRSNASNAEETEANGIQAFETDGFQIGSGGLVNTNGNNYVTWQWKANGGTTSSNTDGSITTTVQANTTAGFSIVTYTGNATDNATIGHGLGATPEWVIIKNRASSIDWAIGHKSIFGNNAENLRFTTGAAASADDAGGSHFSRNAPSSTVITLGDGGDGDFSTDTNRAETHVAYCFTSIKGYSKLGSYKGNGNADGTFVYTGFKPAWIMAKASNHTQGWWMFDNKREGYNPDNNLIQAEGSGAENTSNWIDILSNGFKLRTSDHGINGSYNYIYMAFAEHPFVSSKGVPVTAR